MHEEDQLEYLSDYCEKIEVMPPIYNYILSKIVTTLLYYCKRVLILANFSDFVIIAKFCPR